MLPTPRPPGARDSLAPVPDPRLEIRSIAGSDLHSASIDRKVKTGSPNKPSRQSMRRLPVKIGPTDTLSGVCHCAARPTGDGPHLWSFSSVQ
jgi:hypothetical protein